MSKRITVLGSTGSIGRQSLDVISSCGMSVAALTANSNVERMEQQARQFKPELVTLVDEKAAADLRVRLADTNVKVAGGMNGLLEAAAISSADTVITSVVGMVGLRPTLAAIREGKRIALANKETLVCAGKLVLEEARDYGAQILPVDGGQRPQRSEAFDHHLLRRSVLRKENRGIGACDKGRCLTASQLVHGGENHH